MKSYEFLSKNLIHSFDIACMCPIAVVNGGKGHSLVETSASRVHHMCRVKTMDEIWRKGTSLLHFVHGQIVIRLIHIQVVIDCSDIKLSFVEATIWLHYWQP